MTIRKYIIIVEEEAKSITHKIEISPENLRKAFETDAESIWLYIDGYLKANDWQEKEEN